MPARTVLLATCAALPDGEPDAEVLDRELADRGLSARWATWDDEAVDWSSADLVAVRATWDYSVRAADFLSWAAEVAAATRLLNGADVFAWNHDKAYLAGLTDLPVVPTRLAEAPDELAAAIAELGTAVVKPRVSAGGAGVIVVDDPSDPRLGTAIRSHPTYPAVGGPWIVQPLVESVRTVGESSVFVIGGSAVSRVDKRPAGGEIRVHEQFGGSSVVGRLDQPTTSVAEAAMAVVGERFGRTLDYGRVDLMWVEDRWVVSELELIEPGLYLDVLPGNAVPFAGLLESLA